MRRKLLLFLAMLVWPMTILATIPPAQPIKNFKGTVKRSATRADDNKMGVVTDLKYEKLPDMKRARLWHQVFATKNGLVVVGGHTTDFVPTKTAEVYQDGKWQELSMESAHDGAFSVEISGGGWMIGGGFPKNNGVGQSSDVDVYNPQGNIIQFGSNLSKPRALCKAININGRIFVSGNWYGDDSSIDFYDGSSFTAVGSTDGHYNPYMMPDMYGNVIIFGTSDTKGNPVELYTFSDGSKGLLADWYNVKTGESKYLALPYAANQLPVQLPNDIRSSDYHLTDNGNNYYMVLTKNQDTGAYEVLFYSVEEDHYYRFGNFPIPSRHPDSGEAITYRGGVYVDEVRNLLHLIGSSQGKQGQTVHIVSFNYLTYEWGIASASGFGYDLMQGSWALMPDGRLICTGGYTDSNYHPSGEAYLFTPATVSGVPPGPQKSSKTLVVLTKNGGKTEFVLSEQPKVLFEGKNLRITSTKADVTYALTDILRFTYVNTNPTGINEIAEMDDPTEVSYQDGTLVLSQLKEGAIVGVYSLDGKLLQQLRASHSGTYRLSLSSLPKGVYIVKADTITYKIMKR